MGAPMEHVGVNILGWFLLSDCVNCYVLVAVHYFTKWPEAYAVPDKSTATTARTLVDELFCCFTVLEKPHSNQGQNIEAKVFVTVCKRLRIQKTRTTPHNPQSDEQSDGHFSLTSSGTGTSTFPWCSGRIEWPCKS